MATNLESSSVIMLKGDIYMPLEEKIHHQSYPAVYLVSYNSDCPGNIYPLVEWWPQC